MCCPHQIQRVSVAIGVSWLAFVPACQRPVAEPVSMEVAGVKNLSRAGNVYISGVATPEGLKALQAEGVTTMIDLRLERQVSPADAAAAKELGLERIHVPMDSNGMTEAQAEAFLDAMGKHEGQNVLIHCGSANRAGAMYGLYLGATGACTPDEALRRARAAGMRSPGLAEAVRAYLKEHK